MFKDGYESDRNRVIVYDLASRLRSVWAADWDRSPSRLIWGSNDSQLFVLAQVFLSPFLRLSLAPDQVRSTNHLFICELAYHLGTRPCQSLPRLVRCSARRADTYRRGFRIILSLQLLVAAP